MSYSTFLVSLLYGALLGGGMGALVTMAFLSRSALLRGYRLGLERARQCALYPPETTFRPEARAACDHVFGRITRLIVARRSG